MLTHPPEITRSTHNIFYWRAFVKKQSQEVKWHYGQVEPSLRVTMTAIIVNRHDKVFTTPTKQQRPSHQPRTNDTDNQIFFMAMFSLVQIVHSNRLARAVRWPMLACSNRCWKKYDHWNIPNVRFSTSMQNLTSKMDKLGSTRKPTLS